MKSIKLGVMLYNFIFLARRKLLWLMTDFRIVLTKKVGHLVDVLHQMKYGLWLSRKHGRKYLGVIKELRLELLEKPYNHWPAAQQNSLYMMISKIKKNSGKLYFLQINSNFQCVQQSLQAKKTMNNWPHKAWELLDLLMLMHTLWLVLLR